MSPSRAPTKFESQHLVLYIGEFRGYLNVSPRAGKGETLISPPAIDLHLASQLIFHLSLIQPSSPSHLFNHEIKVKT